MKLKFCGIRRKEDVTFCNALLPDYMGMILSSGFRRSISAETAAVLAAQRDPQIAAVGVFVDAAVEEISHMLETVSLDVIQLHGSETADIIAQVRRTTGLPVWKAVRVQSAAEIRSAQQLGADGLVLEGYVSGQVGGTGVIADWQLLAAENLQTPYLLAGGLRPENLRQALETVQPSGVDLSSGIETDGVKDFEKMKEIVTIIRGGYHG